MPALAAQPGSRAGAEPRKRGRVRRWVLVSAAAVVLLLVAARLALPSFLLSYVNRVLDESPSYDGSVGAIDVHLWRGAYSVRDVKIVKTTRRVPVPFFESPEVDFSLDWRALLHGGVRGRVFLDTPKLNFVQGPTREESQSGADQPWLSMIDELFPFRIDRAEVREGEIHFRAFHTDPEVNVFLADLNATVTNLTNVEDRTDPLIADIRARGTAMGSGRFRFDMSMDPQTRRPDFALAARLLDLDVTRLNNFASAYGGFDFEAGRFDLVVEASAKDGFLTGNVKPLFRGLHVLGERDAAEDNVFQFAWEALVGGVKSVFKNQARDQFGTSFTIEGDLDDPRTDVLEIIGNVLRNAFVRAYLPRFDGRLAPEIAVRRSEGGVDEGSPTHEESQHEK